MNKTITFCIPCYNDSKWLKVCIESILNLNYDQKLIKIIICNDGSKDDSLQVLRKWEKKLNGKLKVIDQTNHGTLYSRYICAMNATTDYILFLDCDDQYYPNAINDFLNTNKNHDYDLIISRFVKTLNGEKQRDFMNYKESVKDINKVIAQNGWSIWNLLIKTSFYKKVYKNIKIPSKNLSILDDNVATAFLLSNTDNIGINYTKTYWWNTRTTSLTNSPLLSRERLCSYIDIFDFFSAVYLKKGYKNLSEKNKMIFDNVFCSMIFVLYLKTYRIKCKDKIIKKDYKNLFHYICAKIKQVMKKHKYNFPENLRGFKILYLALGLKRKFLKSK